MSRSTFARSIARPKRIIAALAPKIPMRAGPSRMPDSIAMSTSMSEALTEYSYQRAGLMPRATFRSYQPRAGPATARWSIAASRRKAPTARSIRRSKSFAGPPYCPAPGASVR